jgi:hypothetical protein
MKKAAPTATCRLGKIAPANVGGFRQSIGGKVQVQHRHILEGFVKWGARRWQSMFIE